MELLLLSNSTRFGGAYLDFAAPHLSKFFNGARKVAFIPYAAITISYQEYERRVNQAMEPYGIQFESVHQHHNPADFLNESDGIAIGGGNTFRLLNLLQQHNLPDIIREKVRSGAPYAGWSAGSNVACPTIRTTNDMPIDFPENANALDLVPFQINPHFTMDTLQGHNGETRLQRLQEFGALNPETMVYGIPEGSYIRGQNNSFSYHGDTDYLWLRGMEHGFSHSQELFQL